MPAPFSPVYTCSLNSINFNYPNYFCRLPQAFSSVGKIADGVAHCEFPGKKSKTNSRNFFSPNLRCRNYLGARFYFHLGGEKRNLASSSFELRVVSCWTMHIYSSSRVQSEHGNNLPPPLGGILGALGKKEKLHFFRLSCKGIDKEDLLVVFPLSFS